MRPVTGYGLIDGLIYLAVVLVLLLVIVKLAEAF